MKRSEVACRNTLGWTLVIHIIWCFSCLQSLMLIRCPQNRYFIGSTKSPPSSTKLTDLKISDTTFKGKVHPETYSIKYVYWNVCDVLCLCYSCEVLAVVKLWCHRYNGVYSQNAKRKWSGFAFKQHRHYMDEKSNPEIVQTTNAAPKVLYNAVALHFDLRASKHDVTDVSINMKVEALEAYRFLQSVEMWRWERWTD